MKKALTLIILSTFALAAQADVHNFKSLHCSPSSQNPCVLEKGQYKSCFLDVVLKNNTGLDFLELSYREHSLQSSKDVRNESVGGVTLLNSANATAGEAFSVETNNGQWVYLEKDTKSSLDEVRYNGTVIFNLNDKKNLFKLDVSCLAH